MKINDFADAAKTNPIKPNPRFYPKNQHDPQKSITNSPLFFKILTF